MPLFMDIHRRVEHDIAQSIAESHQNNIDIQNKYGVKYLKCWYGDKASDRVYCLFEAPNKEAGDAVHLESLGFTADEIIQVNET